MPTSSKPWLTLSLLCACGSWSPMVTGSEDTSDGDDSATAAGSTSTDDPTGDDSAGMNLTCEQIQQRSLLVREVHCARCHGAASAGYAGIDYILDDEQLVASGKVVPADPEGSPLYIRMSSSVLPMPPQSELPRPSDDDILLMREWIARCFTALPCIPGGPTSTDEMLAAIRHDLDDQVDAEARPFTRYLSLVQLANAGLCEPDLEVHRQALSKLVNSLSHAPKLRPPIAIDPRQQIYRIDLRDYGWSDGPVRLSAPSFYFRDGDAATIGPAEQVELDKVFADTWEMIADQNPYSVSHLGAQATAIAGATMTRFPVLQADSFIDVTTRAPLYYDILDIPTRSGRLRSSDPPCAADECLETRLGLDLLADIEDELDTDAGHTHRAGLNHSDVSEFDRVLERHRFADASDRALWLAYDFSGHTGAADIGLHPLDFEFAASALLFNLPNGLQAYMLADAAGQRLDVASTDIFQDPSQRDLVARAGISCIGCHSAGLIRASDDVRFQLDNGMSGDIFDPQQIEAIRDLYPERPELDALQDEDIARFSAALIASGVALPELGDEPVLAAFLGFDEDVTPARAAATLGLSEADLLLRLPDLSSELLELGEAHAVERRSFTTLFAGSVCALDLGLTRCCPQATDQLEPGC